MFEEILTLMAWLNIGLAKKNATSIGTWYSVNMVWTVGNLFIYSSTDKVEPKNVPNCTKVSWHWSESLPTSLMWLFCVSLKTTQYFCWAMSMQRATAKSLSDDASFSLKDDLFVLRTWLKYPAWKRNIENARNILTK